MKTEKQVRTWTIFDGHAEPRIQGPDIAYAENVKVIAHEDHLAIVKGLEARITKLRDALKKSIKYGEYADWAVEENLQIEALDVQARQALKDDEAMG